jgi:hypothetical protein
LLSVCLDNKNILRLTAGAISTSAMVFFSLENFVLRILTSKVLWQAYPRWSRLVHLPLVLKFWGGKIMVQYLVSWYLTAEKSLLAYLTELETTVVEPRLPLTEDLKE